MNSKDTNDKKSARELKQEIYQQLDEVERDIDKIKARMSPGQIIDDAIFYPRGGDSRLVFDHLRANPIGTTFLTLGTLLLMEDNEMILNLKAKEYGTQVGVKRQELSHQKDELLRQGQEKLAGLKSSVTSRLPKREHTPGQAPSKLDIARSRISNAAADLKEKVMGTSGRIKAMEENSVLRSGYDSGSTYGSDQQSIEGIYGSESAGLGGDESLAKPVSDGIESLRSSAAESAGKIRSGVEMAREGVDAVRTRTSELYETARGIDPMTYMVLGAGLGGLTGAALPVFDAEDEVVGQFDDTISEFTRDFQDALKESTSILKSSVIYDLKKAGLDFFQQHI
jgi:hypothetical protein